MTQGHIWGYLNPLRPRCKEVNLLINHYSNTAEPGYNDIGLYDASPITSDIVVPINSTLLTITLYPSFITTLVYNDTKYSVPFMTL
jgi:hypothetical protein